MIESQQTAFESDGQPTQAVDFPFGEVCERIDGEAEADPVSQPQDPARERVALLLDLMAWAVLDASATKVEVGTRILCACYLFKDSIPGAPQSLTELGARLGMTKQSAHECLTHFRAELQAKRQEWTTKP